MKQYRAGSALPEELRRALGLDEDALIVECPHEQNGIRFLTGYDAWHVADSQGLAPPRVASPASSRYSLKCCPDCYDSAPSRVAEAQRRAAAAAAARSRAEAARQELIESGVELLSCPVCEEVFPADDAVQIRYCTHCGQSFNANDGRNCESCNRPFTRKVADRGHADCASDWDEEGDAAPHITDATA